MTINFTKGVVNLPQNTTVDYHTNVFTEDGSEHILQVMPANVDMNREFRKGLVSKSNAMKQAMNPNKLTDASIDAGQNATIDLYAKTIIKGWKGISDDKGKPVQFSVANVTEYLKQMKEHGLVWADLVDFAQDEMNFVKEKDDGIQADEVEDASKN